MPINFESARRLLDDVWRQVLAEKEGETSEDIDLLINSKLVAIRYCLPTQILGKLIDSKLNVLSTQKGDGTDVAAWDPRSLATRVTSPWVSDNQNVLGSSRDPYVGNPLRKPKLEPEPGNVKGAKDWKLLFAVLSEIESRSDSNFTQRRFHQTLRSIRKRLSELSFEYIAPERISLKQVEEIGETFLSESSGGDRGLSVAAALFETFGEYFHLYSKVLRHVINASDQSTGAVADIECLDAEGNVVLAVEVKERDLTLMDVKSGILKARRASISGYLFNAPRTRKSEASDVDELIERSWSAGTNLYRLSVDELIRVGLTLTGERGRKEFIEKVGDQLNKYNTQPSNRQRWKQLLESI